MERYGLRRRKGIDYGDGKVWIKEKERYGLWRWKGMDQGDRKVWINEIV